ncbi:biotin--[acetyl-CoA-carboxylase] ligase [Sphingomonas floccifaciens]|uniref:biotin--[biotin carboxyl-carrier protein] ligase n=1 Tax=Sphingomonas floccifaciens TaxID=1844115 RepID=A0ABW4NFL1_9SPHN
MDLATVGATGSTNADLLAAARAGAAEGRWLRAECQTAGRGRQGRVWDSRTGNLYASTLVRLRPGDPPAATLALVASVALDEAISLLCPALAAGGRLRIKWPNDLLLDGAKLVGILLERADDAVVVGFGVNCAHYPALPDRATTSLADAGCPVEPAILVEALADSFARWVARWRGLGIAPVRARWLDRAHPRGTALVARAGDTATEGLFDGLDADGALVLRLADGSRRVIHAADVFLL